MFLGYNTNGLAHHDLFDAVGLLAEIGYRGVAITIDHNALSPFGRETPRHLVELRRRLDRLGMRSVVETGARYLLDARVKHEPTLLSENRGKRIEFYRGAIDCAVELGSDCVSLWSGVLHASIPVAEAWERLVDGLGEVLDYAAHREMLVGFEPEPGMLVDRMASFESLLARVDRENLRLTLDIGHLQCQGETPIDAVVRRWADRLVNVHIEDMCGGIHEHRMFGEGEIDFPPILRALVDVGYTGGLYVELSRHSHDGPNAARKAFEFLGGMLDEEQEEKKR